MGLALVAALGCRTGSPAQPSPDWPDVATHSTPTDDGRLDAAVIVADDRDGAAALAKAWARYLHHERGIPVGRIEVIGGQRADAKRTAHGIARARRRIRTGGALWIVTMGYGTTHDDGTIDTLTFGASQDRGRLAVSDILRALGRGPQSSSIWIADACHPSPAAGRTGGLAAPEVSFRGQAMLVSRPSSDSPDIIEGDPTAPPTLSATDGVFTDPRALEHSAAAWASPTDVTVITAGTGRTCTPSHVSSYPWVAYGILGGLRGWADTDDNGKVTVAEVSVFAGRWQQSQLPGTQVDAAGTNIVLAALGDDGEANPKPASAPNAARAALPGHHAQTQTQAVAELHFGNRVHVPRGWFRMGCVEGDAECEKDEDPTHHVWLRDYTIDQHEVTWGAYAQCVLADACPKVDVSKCYVWTRDHGFVHGGQFDARLVADDRPVVCVSWRAARAFCHWSGQMLPTEAQWERAARGDTHQRYPWGDADPGCDRAHHDGCADTTRPVGTLTAGQSPLGVDDMAGNVWEWVSDWYDEDAYQQSRTRQEPTGPNYGNVRVVRGGSFYDEPAMLRASYRYGLSPQFGYSNVGFRCRR